MNSKPATYAKLKDGSFGLRGQKLVSGESVTVTTKAGKVSTAVVGRVIAGPFEDGNCLATVADEGRGPSTTQPSVGTGSPCKHCNGTGQTPPLCRAPGAGMTVVKSDKAERNWDDIPF